MSCRVVPSSPVVLITLSVGSVPDLFSYCDSGSLRIQTLTEVFRDLVRVPTQRTE